MFLKKEVVGLLFGTFIGFNYKRHQDEMNPRFKSEIYYSKSFPYALHPWVVPDNLYQYINIKNIAEHPGMPTWFTKNSYLKLKDAKSLEQPFEDFAFRFVRLNEGISNEVADGCLNTILDGFMAMYSFGCTGDPFVTAKLHNTVLKNSLPLGEDLFLVVGFEKTDGRSYFIKSMIFNKGGELLRELSGRFVR